MPYPAISVIIVNFRTCSLLKESLKGIAEQELQAEVFVVDNSVSHEETKCLQELAQLMDFKLITLNSNHGYGRACNIALEQASTNHIFCMNPDVIPLPGSFKRLLDAMKETGAWLMGPKFFWDLQRQFVLPPSPPDIWSTDLMVILSHRFRSLASFFKRYWLKKEIKLFSSHKRLKQNMVSGACFLITKETIEKIGGLFTPDFFLYYEDTDLCKRILGSGGKIYLETAAEMIHLYAQSPADAAEKQKCMEQSRKTFYKKHHHWCKNRLMESLSEMCLVPASTLPDLAQHQDLGKMSSPPTFRIKSDDASLLRVGINQLMFPSAMTVVNNDEFRFHRDLWARLSPGTYFIEVLDKKKHDTLGAWKFTKIT